MKLRPYFFELPFVVIYQLLLVVATFSPLLLTPDKFLFFFKHDGTKNYFTFYAYLKQPFHTGILKFDQFHYPFGEYIFYTDNTPALAIAVKLFSQYIYDVTPHGIFIYHLFLLSSILFSTILVYKILRRLLKSTCLIAFFSLVLPWINPQIMRLATGHFNLSCSWVLLLGIYFVLRSYQNYDAGKDIRRELYWFVPALIICSFIHLYYLLLLLVFVGYFCVAWIIQVYGQRGQYLFLLGWSGVILIVPLAIVYLIIYNLDGYYYLRPEGAGMYNDASTILHWPALFTAYEHNILNSNIISDFVTPLESYNYLGSFALFAGLTLPIIYLNQQLPASRTLLLPDQSLSVKFLWLLGIAALGSLLIAFGESLYFFQQEIPNYLNSFYYLRHFTDKVTQFRCLGRFGWIFFWFINIAAIYLLDALLQRKLPLITRIVIGIAVFLAVLDTIDMSVYHRKSLYPNNFTLPELRKDLELLPTACFSDFQAILPIPFYHYGSEDYEYYLTGDNVLEATSMQLALLSNLPLMSSRMSRTVPNQVKELVAIFTDTIHPALQKKLKAKPILVAIDTSLYNGSFYGYNQLNKITPHLVFEAGRTFVQKHHLTRVGSYQNLQLYRWEKPFY